MHLVFLWGWDSATAPEPSGAWLALVGSAWPTARGCALASSSLARCTEQCKLIHAGMDRQPDDLGSGHLLIAYVPWTCFFSPSVK